MSSSDYITNITTTYTDSSGNSLIQSNDVTYTFYYDTTKDDSWRTDWAIANPFLEGDFGNYRNVYNVWDFRDNFTSSPQSFSLALSASWESVDLLVDKNVTASGYHYPYSQALLVDWYNNDGWEVPNGGGYGEYAATVDMGSNVDVNYVLLTPCFGASTEASKMIKGYRIGVSTEGTENSFVIVASGITTVNDYNPLIVYIGNNTARYLKLYVDSNWGDSSYTRVGKLSAYNNPKWSVYGTQNKDVAGGSYTSVVQTADMTGIDKVFVDIHAYMTSSYQVGNVTISGAVGASSTEFDLKTYNWSNSGYLWADSQDGGWWTRYEEELDLSSYTGDISFRFGLFSSLWGRHEFMGMFDNIDVVPLWYKEGVSSVRGATKYFPQEVYIMSDSKGVSVVDKSDTSLWMRFNIGYGYMLESPATHVFAKNGRLYMSTSLGLYVVDFVTNKCFRFNSQGVYYRMSIGRRNERAYWFEADVSSVLPTNNIFCSSIINDGSNDVLLLGHDSGITAIFNWLEDSRTFYDSSFSYNCFDIMPIVVSDIATAVIFKGGDDSNSFIGVINDPSVFAYDNFDGVNKIHTKAPLDATYVDDVSAGWLSVKGAVPFYQHEGITTFSGIPSDYGMSYMLQRKGVAVKPFSASMDVKIDSWPERGCGGFHFGVTSGWPGRSEQTSTSLAYSLSAINGLYGAYIANEDFVSYPSDDNWVLTVLNKTYTEVYEVNNAVKIHSYMLGPAWADYAPGTVFGHKRKLSGRTFTAKLKVKCTLIDTLNSGDEQAGVIFGISDGKYLSSGSGYNGLFVSLYNDLVAADPAVYCVAYANSNNYISWDTSSSISLFSGDLTDSALWHTWVFEYNDSTKILTASVDGQSVGSKELLSMGNDVGIVFGAVGNQDGYIDVYFKDFEIDFGDNASCAKKTYVLQTYSDGTYTIPTISGGACLDGVAFDPIDGTISSSWKTWLLEYIPPTITSYIDGVEVGSSSVSFDDEADMRLFFGYDASATTSGSDSDRLLSIHIRDFNLSYDGYVVGEINSIYGNNGTRLGVAYDSIYAATSSGVNELGYVHSTSISGSPVVSSLYTIEEGKEPGNVLFGNIVNTVAVEAEPGYVVDTGLLYAGSSLVGNKQWEQLRNRSGGTTTGDAGASIGINSLTGDIFTYYYEGSRFVYKLNTHVPSFEGFARILESNYPDGANDSPSVAINRTFMLDLGDDNTYFCGDKWFGICSASGAWLMPNDNIFDTSVLSSDYRESIVTPAAVRGQLWFIDGTEIGFFSNNIYDWSAVSINNNGVVWSANDVSCVYSEVDDCVYVLEYSTSKLYKFSPSTLCVSDNTISVPFDSFSLYRTSLFYRPYDECIYIVTGSDYGNTVLIYDVNNETWVGNLPAFPFPIYKGFTSTYDYISDSIYTIAGVGSAAMAKYDFNRKISGNSVQWLASLGVLPENNIKPFRKISVDSNAGFLSDSFLSEYISNSWCIEEYDSEASVTTTSSGIYFVLDHSTGNPTRRAVATSAIPTKLGDFSVEAEIKINSMCGSYNGSSSCRNMVIFGISGYKGLPAFDPNVDVGSSVSDINGLFMVATNDYNDLDNKYSTYVSENTADTYYNTTEYEDFSITDGTVSASFRKWKLYYDHSAKSLSAYIDSVHISTVALSGDGFTHGAALCFGAWSEGTVSSGTTSVLMRNLVVSSSGSSSLVSDYLSLSSKSYDDYIYYEKYDTTLSSGLGFSYEVEAKFVDVSTYNNSYVCTIGEIDDGHALCSLVALNTLPRSIGLYSGGDPTKYSSYNKYTMDWGNNRTYTVTHSGTDVFVYVDGVDSPVIQEKYTVLPHTNKRKVLFGNSGVDDLNIVDSFTRNENIVQASGTWTRSHSIDGLLNGSGLTSTDDSVDSKVVHQINTTGDMYLYMFYDVYELNSTSVPVVVYHGGELEVPSDDAYSSNSIASVAGIDEYGVSTSFATTIYVNTQRYADGSIYSRLYDFKGHTPSGWLFLGKYIDVDRVLVCTSGTGTQYVETGAFKTMYTDKHPQVSGDFRFKKFRYTTTSGNTSVAWDSVGGFSVVDRAIPQRLAGYGSSTSPSVVSDEITGFDVIQ